MVVTTAKMNAGCSAEKDQNKENGESTTSNPSTTTAMELSEEARAAISECRAVREDAKRDLDAVLPALETAFRALKLLRKQDIVELKAMKAPPAGVKLTMEAVCVMFGLEPVLRMVKKTNKTDEDIQDNISEASTCASSGTEGEAGEVRNYWDVAKKLLSDPKFLMLVVNYDKDNISEATIRQIAPYLEMKDFEPAVVRKSSVACEALCRWVRTMYMYHMVAKEIAPKREKLRQLEARLVELRGKKKEPTIIATPEKTPPPPPALPDQAELKQEADQAELKQLGNEKEEL